MKSEYRSVMYNKLQFMQSTHGEYQENQDKGKACGSTLSITHGTTK